jgi:hypothetical protein
MSDYAYILRVNNPNTDECVDFYRYCEKCEKVMIKERIDGTETGNVHMVWPELGVCSKHVESGKMLCELDNGPCGKTYSWEQFKENFKIQNMEELEKELDYGHTRFIVKSVEQVGFPHILSEGREANNINELDTDLREYYTHTRVDDVMGTTVYLINTDSPNYKKVDLGWDGQILWFESKCKLCGKERFDFYYGD